MSEPELTKRRLAWADVKIELSGAYAQVTEVLWYDRLDPDSGEDVRKETRFQHGMSPKFSVTKFLAEVFNGPVADYDETKIKFKIIADVKEKKQAREEFNKAVDESEETIYAVTDIKEDSFALSLGAITKGLSVKIVFAYLAEMDEFREPFQINEQVTNGPVGYDLHLPVSFKPKYTLNPGEDFRQVTGYQSIIIQNAEYPSTVKVISDNSVKALIDLNVIMKIGDDRFDDEHDGRIRKAEPPFNDGQQVFRYSLTPEKPDVRLRVFYHERLMVSNDETDINNPSQILSQSTDACMFDFKDLPSGNPLNGKTGVIIDHSIRRDVMNQVDISNCTLPKRQYDFLVDCSGSMAGSAINQTKKALKLALENLPDGCYITMSKFGNQSQWWKNQPVAVNDQTRQEANRWIESLSANMGGTELFRAIKKVIDQPPADLDHKKQIIVITDAAIYNYDEIINLVKNKYESDTSNDKHNRVFVLGVGGSVTPGFCNSLAKAGSGIAEFSAADATISEKINKLLAYASRKGPNPIEHTGFEIRFTDPTGGALIKDYQPASKFFSDQSENGFLGLFSNHKSSPINDKIVEEVTHFRTGFIFEQVPEILQAEIVIGWSTKTENGLFAHQDVFEKTLAKTDMHNPVYWSYIKSELIRRQKNLSQMELELEKDRENREEFTERLEQQKRDLILLSSTTKLLCPLTAFVGVKLEPPKREESEQTEQGPQEARLATQYFDEYSDDHIGTIVSLAENYDNVTVQRTHDNQSDGHVTRDVNQFPRRRGGSG